MTLAIACPQCPGPYKYANSPGVSDEAEIIVLKTKEAQQSGLMLADDNPAIRYQTAIEKLTDIVKECMDDDWDGLGAAAVSYEAIEDAIDLVTLIPMQYPMPEIFPEDGEVTFGWNAGRYKKFLISVRGDGFAYYNGIFGFKNTDFGMKKLRDKLDPEIIRHLDRLYPPVEENDNQAA